MRKLLALPLLLGAQAASAQIVPMPEPDSPRIQTVEWIEGQSVLLTILPGGSITVMLEPDQQIERITLDGTSDMAVRVTPEGNAFVLVPPDNLQREELTVETINREYRFIARLQESALAGLVVRFRDPGDGPPPAGVSRPAGDRLYSYRFRGDTAVQPVSVRDDAARTFIEYAPDQALPAVFAIGPTGEEEVVNGYMRDGVYVIDRVYQELVFRIDRERATARRNPVPDQAG